MPALRRSGQLDGRRLHEALHAPGDDDLAAFYKTPTGKKVAGMLPTLSGEIGTKMATILSPVPSS